MNAALLALVFLTVWTSTHAERVQIPSPSGPLIGETRVVDGRPISRFLGIPYAKPPTGSRRFRRPIPAEPWSTPLEALHWSPICVQNSKSPLTGNGARYVTTKNMSEDCLKLNVWTPEVGTEETKLRPVLVWIHGGGLVIGTSSFDLYDGEMLAAKADAVVVSFNYRLSVLGFLYSVDVPEVKGNQAFWDQNLVLRWVQKNIRSFGGDPALVTIFGESAGGWSVSAHILSPESRSLFKNAILQSGALVSFPMIVEPAVHMARFLTGIRKVGCAEANDNAITAKIVECLEKMDAQAVEEIFYQIDKHPMEPLPPVAVIDGQFIPAKPEAMLAMGNYKTDVNLIASTVEDEGSFVLAMYGAAVPGLKAHNPAPFSLAEAKAFLPSLLTQLYPNVPAPNRSIESFYFSGFNSKIDVQQDAWRRTAGIAFGDFIIGCPTLNFARAVATNSNGTARVFQLYYSAKLGNEKLISHPWAGASHCDDVYPVFSMAFRYPDEFLDRERDIALEMMAYIRRFIRTGSPSAPSGPQWLPYFEDPSAKSYLMTPYYEITEDYRKPDNFKYNLKQVECSDALWGRYY